VSGKNSDKPQLAALVQAGEQQTEAVMINDFIAMAKDISNAYLINTQAGDVMVNAGFMGSAERNQAVLAPVRKGALKYILLTQGHADHYGGVPSFFEPGTQVVAQKTFVATCRFFERLMPYLHRRSGKLWSGTIKGRTLEVPKIQPDIEFDDQFSFELGGRRFELLSTPGGEATDAMVVWMPNERVVFTGNLFGPIFMSMPNLCTMRGDKPRSAERWLDSLDRVRQLNANLLITGHGDPIAGDENIRISLDTMHAAVSFVLEKTLDGMNAGKDVHTLMREIHLPEALKIGEFHGKVSWAVRTIWEEYSGWFHQDYTTSLYGVPRASVDQDLVAMAGGADAFATRAEQKLQARQPLEAMHLLEIALGAEPTNQACLRAKNSVLEKLLELSGGSNLSEVMWLKSEIAASENLLS